MEEIMLNLSEFSNNPHPSGVKMLENFVTRGISVIILSPDHYQFLITALVYRKGQVSD